MPVKNGNACHLRGCLVVQVSSYRPSNNRHANNLSSIGYCNRDCKKATLRSAMMPMMRVDERTCLAQCDRSQFDHRRNLGPDTARSASSSGDSSLLTVERRPVASNRSRSSRRTRRTRPAR